MVKINQKTKKIYIFFSIVLVAVCIVGTAISAATIATNYEKVSGTSEFDKNFGKDDSWTRHIAAIKYNNVDVGQTYGSYHDLALVDKVETTVYAPAGYVRYAVVNSETYAASQDIANGTAYSGKVPLANSTAFFGGGVHIN